MKRLISIYLVSIVSGTVLLGCSTTDSRITSGQSKRHTFAYDGLKRTYFTYIPKGIEKSHPAPLLIALHGGYGSADKWPEYTNNGFERLADRDHFILVYPDALEGHWNDGRDVEQFYSQREKIDDSEFLITLIDQLTKVYTIDTSRIYVTGASNGGMMAHRLAAEHTDKIAAIAAVISSIPKNLDGKLHPAHPVSVLMMNGMEDPLVPWEGGLIKFGRKESGYVTSTEHTFKFWARYNQCSLPVKSKKLPDVDPDDGTRVIRMSYSRCHPGTDVVLYKIIGGGHTWPGQQEKHGYIKQKVLDILLGKQSRDIDACEVIWEFFKNHPK